MLRTCKTSECRDFTMSYGGATDVSTSKPTSLAEPAIDEPRAPSRLETRFGVITVAVSVLAGLLAMINITRVSMWVDEAYTLSVATRSLTDVWSDDRRTSTSCTACTT